MNGFFPSESHRFPSVSHPEPCGIRPVRGGRRDRRVAHSRGEKHGLCQEENGQWRPHAILGADGSETWHPGDQDHWEFTPCICIIFWERMGWIKFKLKLYETVCNRSPNGLRDVIDRLSPIKQLMNPCGSPMMSNAHHAHLHNPAHTFW